MNNRNYSLVGAVVWLGIFLLVISVELARAQSPLGVENQTESYGDELDAFINQQMRELKIPGLALAVVRGDQIETMRGYGVSDDSARPVTPQTPFLVASLSKSFTALGVMQLVEEGKIDLDAPVQTYLPWFHTADRAASAQITIRHLLHHTSGQSQVDGYRRNLDGNQADGALEASVRGLEDAALRAVPGGKYEYSNSNYDILGLVIQTVSGKTYETYIEENIFAPLEMRNSFTSLQNAREGGVSSGYISFFGLTLNYDRSMPYARGVVPSAGLFSSAEDMARYLLVHLNEGRYPQGAALLSPGGAAALHTPAVAVNDTVQYAMGWVTWPFPDLAAAKTAAGTAPVVLSHGGEWANYKTLMLIAPQQRLGVVMLMNKVDNRRTEAYESIFWNTVLLAEGLEPALKPGSPDFLTKYGQAVGLVTVLLLAAGFTWSVRVLLRRHADFSRRTIRTFAILPLLDLAVAGIVLFVEMPASETSLPLTLAFFPEVGLMYLAVLILTLGWGLLRTVLFFTRLARMQAVPLEAERRPEVPA